MSCVGGERNNVDDLRVIREMAVRLKQIYCSEQRHLEETANEWGSSPSSCTVSKRVYSAKKLTVCKAKPLMFLVIRRPNSRPR